MVMKSARPKVYKTMTGKTIDIDLLRKRNELTRAVGNARMNARGDLLGPGGKIVRKREEVLRDYYRSHPAGVPDETTPRKDLKLEESQNTSFERMPTGEDLPEAKNSRRRSKKDEVAPPTSAEMAEWEEDAEGNFIKRG